jgi:hypothetical protein
LHHSFFRWPLYYIIVSHMWFQVVSATCLKKTNEAIQLLYEEHISQIHGILNVNICGERTWGKNSSLHNVGIGDLSPHIMRLPARLQLQG